MRATHRSALAVGFGASCALVANCSAPPSDSPPGIPTIESASAETTSTTGSGPSANVTASSASGVGGAATSTGSTGVMAGSVSTAAGGSGATGTTAGSTGTTLTTATASSANTGAGGGVSTTGGALPTPSAGCGVPWAPADVTIEDESWRGPAAQVVRREIEIAGSMRRYMVVVPLDYDPSREHALILAFHGLGGDREQLRGYMNLEEPAGGAAVVVYPEGLVVQGSDTGWDLDADSNDLVFVDTLYEKYTAELCIDQKRVFATGHSYGGCMTNSVGCFRGDRIRGIAPVAGCGPFGRNATCSGQVAAMIIHSPYDTTTDYASGMQACNSHMTANHCDQTPECGCHWVEALDQDADECVQEAQAPYVSQQSIEVTEDDAEPPTLRQYLNCDPGFPVVHIEHYNGRDPRYHNPPAWAPAVIWEFFSGLPNLE